MSPNDVLTCVRFSNHQYYIRQNTASTIARRMQYLDESVEEASQHAVDDLFRDGGMGGIIAVDKQGNGNDFASLPCTFETNYCLDQLRCRSTVMACTAVLSARTVCL